MIALSQAHSQQTADSTTVGPAPVTPEQGSVMRYGIDLNTYEFLDLVTGDRSALNSPDQIQTRRREFLRLTDPVEYYRQFPKTQEQAQIEEAKMAEILTPLTLQQRAAIQTPEEREAEQKIINSFLTGYPSSTQPTQ